MKNLIILFYFVFCAISIHAQSREFNRLYADFRGQEGVINIYVPGFLCRMAGNIAELEEEEKELLRSIKSVKLLVIENPEINRQLNLAKVIARANLEPDVHQLLRVRDGDEDVLILARQEKERISELYVIVGGDENVMIRICGRMDHDLMKSLYEVTGIEKVKYTQKIQS
jgi:hypothetical protein